MRLHQRHSSKRKDSKKHHMLYLPVLGAIYLPLQYINSHYILLTQPYW